MVDALPSFSDEDRRIVFSIVGLLIFFRPAINGIESALHRQGNAPVARSMGFTNDLVEKINALSTFYLLFVYTQLIAKIYGVSGSLPTRIIDVVIFFGFAVILTHRRFDAVSSFRKWKDDPTKKRYLRKTLIKYGGTWLQVWGLLVASFVLLLGQFAEPQELYKLAQSAVEVVAQRTSL